MTFGVEALVFFLLIFISTRRYQKQLYFRFLPYIIMFVFMAIRYDYGDGKSYRMMFTYLHNGINIKDIEPLYVWVNRILPSFDAVVIVTSLVYVFLFYYVLSKVLTYEQRGLALLVMVLHPYILMIDMSAIRQSIAIAIVFCGVYIANRYKCTLFIPFCLVATLFHKSAIILLPIVFLFEKRHFSKKVKWILFSGTVFFLIAAPKLVKVIESILTALKLNTNNYLAYLYSGYTNGNFAVVLSLLIMLFFMLYDDEVEKENAIYVKLSIIAMIMEALQGSIQSLGRIEMYFLPFFIISVPLIVKNTQQELNFSINGRILSLGKRGMMVIEACFVLMLLWKMSHFMTPQYAYHAIFSR